MKLSANEIFEEYRTADLFKQSLGDKGIYEQGRINSRFFAGDQWKGAVLGNERPLIRHNIIKRIGDFKMSQIMSGELEINYRADGIENIVSDRDEMTSLKRKIVNGKQKSFEGEVTKSEMNLMLNALSDYRKTCAARLDFDAICAKALKDAYITGSGVIYTYWDSSANGGSGDIGCEVLSINDLYYGDPYQTELEEQPFIIIKAVKDTNAVCRDAGFFGNKNSLKQIREDSEDGKVLLLTKLYKEQNENGKYTVKCIQTTENAVVRNPFDTNLTMYPVAAFNFEDAEGTAYGESEITYLIPNQIAINRMITANVWSSMSMGMPIMVVNGDTVTGDITNDPGQIIKIYGSNEDVKNAVNFITPPDYSKESYISINNLIENTLTQSGANAVVLGDARPDNATALITVRDSALLSLKLIKSRFYGFVRRVARIWADFYINSYGERNLCIEDENGIWYFPFSAKRYGDTQLNVKIDVSDKSIYDKKESFGFLLTLYEKGIITKEQLLKRLPEGIVSDAKGLLTERVKDDDGI